MNPNTDLIDAQAFALTDNDADELEQRLQGVAAQAARYHALAQIWDELGAVLRCRLDRRKAPQPPVDIADEPEEALRFERAAHQAVAEQARAGEHPYAPADTHQRPHIEGYVDVPGEFASSDLNGSAR